MVSVCFQPPSSEGVSGVYHGVCMLSATTQWRGVRCVSWCVCVCFQPPPSEGVSVVYHGVSVCFQPPPSEGVCCVSWCVCMLSATTQWRGVSCVSSFQPPPSEGVCCVSWCVCMLSATTQWRGCQFGVMVSVCTLSATTQWRGCQFGIMVSVCMLSATTQWRGCQFGIMVSVCMLSATTQWRGVSLVSWCLSVRFQPPPSEGVSVWYHGVCLYAFSHHPVKGVSFWCHGVCLYAFSHHPVKGCQFGIMVSVCFRCLSVCFQPPPSEGVSVWYHGVSVCFQPPPSEGGVILVSWCLSVCFQPPPSEGGVSLVSGVLPWRTHCSHTGMAGLQHILSNWLRSHLRVHLSAPPLTCHCCCGQSSVHNQGTESFSWKCVYCNLVRRWTLCLKVWQFGNSCLPHRTEGLALWYLCTSAYHTEPKVIVW